DHLDQVLTAVDAMNGGQWEEALNHLKLVPRSSPWSDLKLFCKAMTHFAQDEGPSVIRSLSQLSDSFPFPSAVRALKLSAEGKPSDAASVCPRMFDILFEGHGGLIPMIDELVRNVTADNLSRIPSIIRSIASGICPRKPEDAIRSMVEIIWQRCSIKNVYPEASMSLTKQLFLKEEALRVAQKAFFNYGPTPLSDAAEYLNMIDKDFKDVQENAMARSQVFTRIASDILNNEIIISDDFEGFGEIAKIVSFPIKKTSYFRNLFCLRLIEHATDIDPVNREAYELAESLQLRGTEAKPLEMLYETMMKHFPDDPYPCLKLADIYDRKGAYRKAEGILKNAMERAPHNNFVFERYVFSCVIAAEKNIRSDKLHLVEKDLEKAASLRIPQHVEVIAEKKILYNVLKAPDGKHSETIEYCLSGLSSEKRLRVLSLLICDTNDKGMPSEQIFAFFKKELQEALPHLPSSARVKLLMPVKGMHALVYPDFSVADVFIKNAPVFLGEISDSDLANALSSASIITKTSLSVFIKDIHRRIKKEKTVNPLIRFCHAALKFSQGENDKIKDLDEITKSSSPDIRGRMKAISMNISLLANDYEACCGLKDFDFAPDDGGFDSYDIYDDDDGSAYYDPYNDMDVVASPAQELSALTSFLTGLSTLAVNSPVSVKQKFIEALNALADLMDLKDLSDSGIVRLRKDLINTMPMFRNKINKAPALLGEDLMAKLTPEARVLLTGSGE
ncbi:MAG: hypothetical protein WC799_25545, partial [Desulfobacteraceae bacterium]